MKFPAGRLIGGGMGIMQVSGLHPHTGKRATGRGQKTPSRIRGIPSGCWGSRSTGNPMNQPPDRILGKSASRSWQSPVSLGISLPYLSIRTQRRSFANCAIIFRAGADGFRLPCSQSSTVRPLTPTSAPKSEALRLRARRRWRISAAGKWKAKKKIQSLPKTRQQRARAERERIAKEKLKREKDKKENAARMALELYIKRRSCGVYAPINKNLILE